MLFKYTSKIQNKNQETGEETEVVLRHKFNTDHVVQSYEVQPGVMVVLMDDGHEEAEDVEKVVAVKNGQPKTEIKRERIWKVSQVILEGEDADRWWDLQ